VLNIGASRPIRVRRPLWIVKLLVPANPDTVRQGHMIGDRTIWMNESAVNLDPNPFHLRRSHPNQPPVPVVVASRIAFVAPSWEGGVFLLSNIRASISRSSSSTRARASSRYFSCDKCVCRSCRPCKFPQLNPSYESSDGEELTHHINCGPKQSYRYHGWDES
jgi:hypothetical protein